MGPIQTLNEFINLLLRRRLMIAVVTLTGAIVATLFAMTKPQVYETSAVIQVETPVVGGDPQAASGQTARLLQAIEQRLTTRENLLEMARRHDLFGKATGLTEDQRITIMRESIDFHSVAAATEQAYGVPTNVSALLITARFGTADQAARLANDLAQSVLDMSVARQSSRARENAIFFAAEDARVAQQITSLEGDIAAYKNNNIAAMGVDPASERADIETDLRELRQSESALQTERLVVTSKERLRVTDQRRIAELDAQLSVLQNQRAQLETQLEALNVRVAQSPDVERRLGAFDRELQQLQSQYTAITARKADAETDLRLEQENHTEHFTLLERAIRPENPNGGGRKKLAIAGAFGSLILAVGLAFILDLMKPVIRSAGQMEREIGIRPVITIPDFMPVRREDVLARRLWDWARSMTQKYSRRPGH